MVDAKGAEYLRCPLLATLPHLPLPPRPRVAGSFAPPGSAHCRLHGAPVPGALGGSPLAPAATGFLARVSAGTGAWFPAAVVGEEKGVHENLRQPQAPAPTAAGRRGVGAGDGKDRGIWSRI